MAKELKRLFDTILHQLEYKPNEVCLSAKENGKWIPRSTSQVVDSMNAFSRGLLSMGVKPGDKIALISNNRPEWNIADLGILQIGAVDVPVYPTIGEEDYKFIFNHAEVTLCFVSDKELLDKVLNIKGQVPTLKEVYTFDEIEGAANWEEVLKKGGEQENTEVEKLRAAVKEDDLATIIYTSGTTGKPKGVMLSHKNVLSNAKSSTKRLPTFENARTITFLPVSHIYERMLHYLYMMNGMSIYYAESMETIGDNIREVKPHIFTAVPRLLEKVYDKIIDKGSNLTGIKKGLFFWAVSLAEKWEPYGGNSAFYKLKHSIADKLIFSKWREALGGETIAVASGSAALQPRLSRVFNAAGVPVMEGYGLTETSPVVAVNEQANRGFMIGTVGRVIEGVEVKMAQDGEILVKGPNVMQGYYKDEEKTKEVFTNDGWLKTGDIGEFTGYDRSFLKITDRKKEMFKTSGGKYIAPQPIENMLKSSVFVEQAMIVGEGEKHPAVLIAPTFDNLKTWCKKHNIPYTTNEEMVKNEKIRERIWRDVQEKTAHLGKWEIPKKMELSPAEWTIETEELTPTLKLKRRNIFSKYKELIVGMYR